MSNDKHLRCSFCGKSKDSVRKFISGPSVYICNECITLCNEILAEDEDERVSTWDARTGRMLSRSRAEFPEGEEVLDLPDGRSLLLEENELCVLTAEREAARRQRRERLAAWAR